MVTTGVGISTPTTSSDNIIITGNKIYREGRAIARYISLSTGGNINGSCTGNVFDDFTIDGVDDEVINGFGSTPTLTLADGWIVERNKNQTVTINIAPSDGLFLGPLNTAVGTGNTTYASYIEPGVDSLLSTSGGDVVFWLADQNINQEFYWVIPAKTCLPMWVTIINFSVNIDSSDPDVQDLARATIRNENPFTEETTGDSDPALGITLSLTPTGTFRVTPTSRINMNLLWRSRTSGVGTEFANVNGCQITYRW